MRYTAARCLAPAAVLVGLAILAGCGPSRTPQKPEDPGLTATREIEISREALPVVERRFGGLLADLAVQAYVRAVGERLARHTPMHDFPYYFAVLDTPMPVALAIPGGDVFVSRGILKKLNTESELAAILAHLAAHMNARHSQQRTDPRLLAEVARTMARDESTVGSAPAAQQLAALIAKWTDVAYTSEMEAQADRLAMDYLAAAGYNPASVVRLAEIMEAVAGPGAAEFAAAHPPPAGHVEELRRELSAKYPDRGGREAPDDYRREVLDRLR